MRLTISAIGLLLLSTVEARPAAWTLPQDHWQMFSAATVSQAARSFDVTGHAGIPTRFTKLLVQNCYEYGLTNALTVFATPAYAVAEVGNPAESAARVPASSIEFGGRLALLSHHGHLSAQVSYKNAGAFDLSVSANREPGHQLEMRLLYGTNFVLRGYDGFVDLQLAERWISPPRPNETPLDLTVGLWLWRSTMVMTQSLNIFGSGRPGGPYPLRYRSHKLELSVVERLSRHWSVQASVFFSPAGQSALVERGVGLALWTQV